MFTSRTDLVASKSELSEDPHLGAHPVGPIQAVLRHKMLAISFLVGIGILTALVILFYPRKYHSTAKLLLRIGRENVTLDPTASTAGDTQMVMRTRESEIITALEMMASREILNDVVDTLGSDVILSGVPKGGEPKPKSLMSKVLGPVKSSLAEIDPIEDRERAILELEGSLLVSAPSEGGVVTVEYVTDTPELAQTIVENWIELFQDHYVTATRTRGAFEFFEQQDKLITGELEGIRSKIRDAKNLYGLATIDGQQRQLEQQMQTVRLEQLTNESRITEVETRIAALEKLASETAPTKETQIVTGVASEATENMRARLYELQVEEKEASAYLTPNHPKLAAIREQIELATEVYEASKVERTEVTEAINPTRQIIDEKIALEQADLDALGSKALALDVQEQNLLTEISELNKHEQVVADLTRKLEILEERYRVHSERFEQARLDQALEEERISSVNVVQAATLEYRPVTPQKKLCVVFGLLAGLASAVGIPLWIEAGKSAEMTRVRLKELTAEPESMEPSLSDDYSPAEPRPVIPR